MHVTRITPNALIVTSRSNMQLQYIVTVERDKRQGTVIRARCTCPWAQHGGAACSHVLAALHYLAAQQQRVVSFWLDAEDARRQKHRVLTLKTNDGDVFITSRPMQQAG